MATFSNSILLLLLLLLILFSSGTGKLTGEPTGTKKTRLHFFSHDTIHHLSSPATTIIQPLITMQPTTNTEKSLFGNIAVVDDPLTDGPDPTSKMIGRAQGMSIFSSSNADDPAMLVNVNLVFTEGKHNGSTLVMLGRVAFRSKMRELPVIAGTGKFQFALGYAMLTTHSRNLTTGGSSSVAVVVEYHVRVSHH
ncbi:dirigent protein 21-like [Dioscorea cayenensis subsp. rotundata]|uniref:Dirigent protein n=1 Tax=Dioscorea cayennensis subsp. rotundata TaxID=55577 RepID=A0AB40AK85_DIOCR|nr:dirigent protein 21-like [Dioscorea cayenensis subsp. rotundata]